MEAARPDADGACEVKRAAVRYGAVRTEAARQSDGATVTVSAAAMMAEDRG